MSILPKDLENMLGTAKSFKKGNNRTGTKHSEKTKEKIRKSSLGKIMSDDARKKMSIANIGKKLSLKTRKKMSESKKGSKNHNWKGGKYSENEKIRKSFEYKLWRKAVFARDNYTCVWCGTKDRTIQADHIKPLSIFPELSFAIDNGRTLCDKCHKTTKTYLNRWISREDFLDEDGDDLMEENNKLDLMESQLADCEDLE